MDKKSDTLVFFVNGRKIEDDDVDPDFTLLRYLREILELPGTKLGCSEGGCGACTVMVSKFDNETDIVEHYSVNACLAPVASMHGLAVTTVEGIGSSKTKLHPVQERLAKSHGSQCGFCTPGFVMSMYTILRNNPQPSMQEIEEGLVGNLCRCTGYRPILEGFRTFSKDAQNVCGRKDCCKLQNGMLNLDCNEINKRGKEYQPTLFDKNMFPIYDPSQDLIFPPELKIRYSNLVSRSLVFRGPRTTFFRPTTLKDLLDLKRQHPEAKIVIGNSEVGVEVKFKNQIYPIIINPMNVSELLQVYMTDAGIEVGAAIPISKLQKEFTRLSFTLKDHQSQVLREILKMMNWFSGRQIRNVAALGGNIMTGSPISDLNQIFMAAGSKVKFQNADSHRVAAMNDNFYTSYRKNTALPDEVMISVTIPLTNENDYFWSAKQSRRRDDDVAIVNCAMKVSLKENSSVIESLTMAFGGMSSTTIMAKQTAKFLEGRKWDQEMVDDAISSLLKELKLDPSAPGGMVQYRETLCASFFIKFYHHVHFERQKRHPSLAPQIHENSHLSFMDQLYEPFKSTQFYQNVPEDQDEQDTVGRPISHVSGFNHATGESIYVDDTSKIKNELYASLVLSSRCHAKIIAIDPSEALAVDGVKAFFSARDLTEFQNKTGIVIQDEEVFASTEVKCVGQIIGIVVAKDQLLAQRAAKKVQVLYEDLPNPIITIQDAIKAKAFWESKVIEFGDVTEGFKSSDHILKGETYLGGQEHFYLETNAHIAIPGENQELVIISSTQHPTLMQASVAKALNIPVNRVICRVKRLGGGFGGKVSRSCIVAIPVAIAAHKLGLPVRIMLDRDEDMLITGTRHPFFAKWSVGFKSSGIVETVELDLYSNAGCTLDLSLAVMEKALVHLDSVYKFNNFKATGTCCKTNIPSCTGFRGFGAPQGSFIMEDVITRVAEYLNINSVKVKQMNFYQLNGDVTPYGQVLNECFIMKCWEQLLTDSNYISRKSDVEKFNRSNSSKKRGLSVTPAKHCIAYLHTSNNQSGALVNIYLDGSVIVNHSGVEMGQGLHTKMLQVASKVLKVPLDKIYVIDTSTDKIPNTPASASSCGSDLNGMAVMVACEKLNTRLEPYKKRLPKGEFIDWIKAANEDRISLSATGFYRTPGISQYKFDGKPGMPINYFCYGAAISEVEIDCLTGDHILLRTDIVMDVGRSLNPAIDIGQIEGAFVNGMGYFTTEELIYSSKGELLSRGPGAYKIPSIKDIPREFNVALLKNSHNPKAIYSSKAVGEPPLLLSASVFFAIKDAIKRAREDRGFTETFQLQSPATAERIRMSCKDHITDKIEHSENGTFIPWSVQI